MVWFIAACAVVVILVAALAATGRLGALGRVSDDTPGSGFPDDPTAPVDLPALRFGTERLGYAPESVDEFLDRVESGTRLDPAAAERIKFPMARSGYAVSQVDAVIDRLVSAGAAGAAQTSDVDELAGVASGGSTRPAEAVSSLRTHDVNEDRHSDSVLSDAGVTDERHDQAL